MNKIIIYTDGSSKGNPGPGGWAAIIVDSKQTTENSTAREIGGKEEMTTNNRMELKAAIEALRLISSDSENFSDADQKNNMVEIFADSEYVIKGITLWIKNWQKNNWRTKDKKEVMNQDLWQELWSLVKNKNIEWRKVLGHSGEALNERCDEIAQTLAEGKKVNLYNGSKSGYFLFHQQ